MFVPLETLGRETATALIVTDWGSEKDKASSFVLRGEDPWLMRLRYFSQTSTPSITRETLRWLFDGESFRPMSHRTRTAMPYVWF